MMGNKRTYTIHVKDIPIEVTRKKVKYLRIVAYPSRKSVRISSPMHIKRKDVVDFAESRADWIIKHFNNPEVENGTLSEKFTDGSIHYLWGKPFTLRLSGESETYCVRQRSHDVVELCVKPGSDQNICERVMREWYRRELKRPIPALIKKWEPVMNVQVKEWNVKKMKTRWGTCNTKAGRIWLSLELAKKSPEYLEYIVVHEMTHLLERAHSKRFYSLMDRFYSGWRETDKKLGGKHWRRG